MAMRKRTALPDACVDLETLSLESDSAILSIGVVFFDSCDSDDDDSLRVPDRHFYRVLDMQEQIDLGLNVSAETLRWWMQQSKLAQQVWGDAPQPVTQVLTDLTKAFVRAGTARLWGNGCGFDNVLLRNLYKAFGLEFPIRYANDMDLRTLRYLAEGPRLDIPMGVAHNALDDAIHETLVIQALHARLFSLKHDFPKL